MTLMCNRSRQYDQSPVTQEAFSTFLLTFFSLFVQVFTFILYRFINLFAIRSDVLISRGGQGYTTTTGQYKMNVFRRRHTCRTEFSTIFPFIRTIIMRTNNDTVATSAVPDSEYCSPTFDSLGLVRFALCFPRKHVVFPSQNNDRSYESYRVHTRNG